MTQSQEFAIRNLRNGRTLSIVDYIPAITISAFAVCAIIYASRKLTTFDFGNSTIIIECCTTMANIINNTTSDAIFNRQCAIISNRMLTLAVYNRLILSSCVIYQRMTRQIQSNFLIFWNCNCFGVIIIQSNGSTIFRLVNLPLQSLSRCSFTGTSAVSRLNAIRRKCHRRHSQHHHHSEKSR